MSRISDSWPRAAAEIVTLTGTPRSPGCPDHRGARHRHVGIEIHAPPAPVALAIELIRGPVVLVELQGDDVGHAVPTDGLQPERGPVRLAAHDLDESVQVRRRLAVHLRDAPSRVQAVMRGRR